MALENGSRAGQESTDALINRQEALNVAFTSTVFVLYKPVSYRAFKMLVNQRLLPTHAKSLFTPAGRTPCFILASLKRSNMLARAAFNFAVERRMLLYSPLAGVKPFNEAKYRKPPRAMSCTEEQRILMCCDARLRLILIVLLYTGMRVGIEALRIKWTDVDFEEEVITVAQSKTAAGVRALPMTEFVASELLKWYAATKGISEYVFFNPQRPSTHIHSVKTAWHHALKLAGIPRFPIYQCRHTFATRLAGLGVSDTIIDQLLGHSRRDVLRFYTARVPEYLRDAINLLEKLRSAKTGQSSVPTIEAIRDPIEKGPTLIN